MLRHAKICSRASSGLKISEFFIFGTEDVMLSLAHSDSLWLSQALSGSLLLSEFANTALARLVASLLRFIQPYHHAPLATRWRVFWSPLATRRSGVCSAVVTLRNFGHPLPSFFVDIIILLLLFQQQSSFKSEDATPLLL